MPIRCKSCGFLNKEGTKSCERCSFDLRYSIIFDKALENETNNPKMLFDIEKIPETEETNFDNILDYDIKNEINSEEELASEDELESKEIYRKNYERQRFNQITKTKVENFKLKKILVSISVEFMIFMVLYLTFHLIIKFFFPSLSLQNNALIIITLFFYSFFTTYSLFFKGRIFSFVILEKYLNNNQNFT